MQREKTLPCAMAATRTSLVRRIFGFATQSIQLLGISKHCIVTEHKFCHPGWLMYILKDIKIYDCFEFRRAIEFGYHTGSLCSTWYAGRATCRLHATSTVPKMWWRLWPSLLRRCGRQTLIVFWSLLFGVVFPDISRRQEQVFMRASVIQPI